VVDRSAIGHSFTPVHATVEPGRLRYFFNALGERNPIYRDTEAAKAAGYAAIPIPPTYLFCLEMMDAEKPFELLRLCKSTLPGFCTASSTSPTMPLWLSVTL
jgi:acyl dehydratase